MLTPEERKVEDMKLEKLEKLRYKFNDETLLRLIVVGMEKEEFDRQYDSLNQVFDLHMEMRRMQERRQEILHNECPKESKGNTTKRYRSYKKRKRELLKNKGEQV